MSSLSLVPRPDLGLGMRLALSQETASLNPAVHPPFPVTGVQDSPMHDKGRDVHVDTHDLHVQVYCCQ